MNLKLTALRPTVMLMELLGALTIMGACIILGGNPETAPVVAAWLGSLLARLREILKDSPDDRPTFRSNILLGGLIACAVMITATWLWRDHAAVLIPILTGFAAAFGQIILKQVNNEDSSALQDAFNADAAGEGCRYPKE